MNIFVIDDDPVTCARALDDRRVIKMTTETAQMISDAIRVRGGIPFYERCNPNHPCTKWVGQTQGNFLWTLDLLKALNDEYRFRYCRGVDHGAYTKGYEAGKAQVKIFPLGDRLQFQNSSIFKEEKDVIIAYRKTLIHKWSNFKLPPRWTRVEKPDWVS